ncbi:MAG: DUF1330 domain-containing protein [Rhodospirillaceae bacterium]|nr:DUF1330 domain-containing protein [Rhodospirillaceae bacterium]
MPKGYCIAHLTVTDAANYPNYREAAGAAIATYGGRFLVRAGQYELPEGGSHERHVILEFESFEQAKKFYHSPEYQAAAKLRQATSDSTFVIVEGAA